MAEKKKALIAGATGLVGGNLLKLLLADEAYSEVRVIGRRETEYTDSKINETLLDFKDLDEYEHLFEVDDVFCCLGTTIKKAGSEAAFKKVDQEYPLHMAQLSKAKGVNHFLIVTAMGADESSLIFYNKVKGQVEEGIRELKLNRASICRPSLLLGDRNEFRMGEQIGAALMKIANPLFLGPLKKYKGIEAATVAKAMLNIAQKEETGFHIYESDELLKLGS